MDSVKSGNPLGTEKIGKLIFTFAVPSIISMVVNALYNIIDQIFIGQGVGYLGNGATNVVMPLTITVIALSLLIGDGAAAYMSLKLGEGDRTSAAKGVGNAVIMAFIIGIIMCALFNVFLEPLCKLFGATAEILPYALDYGRIISFGVLFSTLDSGLSGLIRADGSPKYSMVGLLIGCITNIICDPIFIFAFRWGVKGAAFATILGQILNAIWYLGYIRKFKSIKLDKTCFDLSFGYNYGCGQIDRVKQTYRVVLVCATAMLVFAFCVFQSTPMSIVRLFGSESDLYNEFAVKCFRIFLLLCPIMGVQMVTGIFFQAIGKPVQSSILSLSRQILYLIPASLLLPLALGVEGVLWAGPIADFLAFLTALTMLKIYWKKL
jgi:Na+-driven multidrug efflux pump